MKIAINKIQPDPKQPRKTFDDIQELADSIKHEGILQPILVDAQYQIIDGERRYRAAKLLKFKEVEAIVLGVGVKDEKKRVILQLLVDVHNKKLPILERDQAVLRLWKIMGRPSGQTLAKTLSVSETTISDALERARYIPTIKNSELRINPHAIISTRGLKDRPELRKKAIEKITKMGSGVNNERAIAFVKKIKQAKSDNEIEAIIEEPFDNYIDKADKVIAASRTIIANLDATLLIRIPPQQGFILTGTIEELEKHLKTYKIKDADLA